TTPAPGQVYGLDWTPDGRVLAASSSGFQCMDPTTGRERWHAATPDGVAWRVAGSADGGAVGVLHTTAVVSYDAAGAERARLAIDGAHDLAPLPDRRSVFVLREEYVQELDCITLAESARLSPKLPDVARELSISPDGSLVALGDMAGHVSVMDRQGSVRWTVRVPGAPEVIGTCFSPDGSMVAAVGGQSVALLSSLDGATRWVSTSGRNGARAACFTPDGRSLLVGGWTEVIERLRVDDATLEALIAGAYSQVWSIAPEPMGTSIATGCLRAVVQRFPMDGQLRVSRLSVDQAAVRSVVPMGSDRVLASTMSGKVVEVSAREPLATEVANSAQVVARTANGMLGVARDARVHWIMPDGARVDLEQRDGDVRVADLSMQDGWTAVLWTDGVQWILRCGEPAPVHRTEGSWRGSRAALIDAHHGRAIIFRGSHGSTTLLDLAAGGESPAPFEIEHPMRGARSPDGTLIAIGSMDQGAEVAVLDAATLRVLHRCPGHRSPITALAWIEDGSRLASASNDGTVRVWETESMREALTPLAAQVFDLCWTADGTLWAAGADGNLYRMVVR
ncbi:MAG: WD40 repeat domain-containing protein, partial [Planctomycetes bacterium]|nr:WD40 repeat domain-containing protein [Planctomycetota bacterium]